MGQESIAKRREISNAKSESVIIIRREVANRLTLTGESSSN